MPTVSRRPTGNARPSPDSHTPQLPGDTAVPGSRGLGEVGIAVLRTPQKGYANPMKCQQAGQPHSKAGALAPRGCPPHTQYGPEGPPSKCELGLGSCGASTRCAPVRRSACGGPDLLGPVRRTAKTLTSQSSPDLGNWASVRSASPTESNV